LNKVVKNENELIDQRVIDIVSEVEPNEKKAEYLARSIRTDIKSYLIKPDDYEIMLKLWQYLYKEALVHLDEQIGAKIFELWAENLTIKCERIPNLNTERHIKNLYRKTRSCLKHEEKCASINLTNPNKVLKKYEEEHKKIA